MNLMRKIIKWCDEKQEEAFDEPNQTKANAKAFVGGFVEGFCDSALIMYVRMVICNAILARNTKNK